MAIETRAKTEEPRASVSRPASVGDDEKESLQAWLPRSLREAVEEATRADTERRRVRNEIASAVNERVFSDPVAVDLLKKAFDGVSAIADRPLHVLSGFIPWVMPISVGTTILAPPFDDGGTFPAHPPDMTHTFSWRNVGKCQAYAGSAGGNGFAATVANLSMWAVAGKTGTLEIRPFIRYDYQGYIQAWALSGWTGGRVDLLASINGQTVGQRSKDLWSRQSESDVDVADAGIVFQPDINLRIPVAEGSLFTMTIAAVAMRDQSGHHVGYSDAVSLLNLEVPFMTLELH
jgi:hypothetical protein